MNQNLFILAPATSYLISEANEYLNEQIHLIDTAPSALARTEDAASVYGLRTRSISSPTARYEHCPLDYPFVYLWGLGL